VVPLCALCHVAATVTNLRCNEILKD